MDLQHKQSKAVSVTSMSFLSGDVNNFVVGSEDGSVYTGHRHGRCVQSIRLILFFTDLKISQNRVSFLPNSQTDILFIFTFICP